jgi:ribosome-associated translation inhibitor RaiA
MRKYRNSAYVLLPALWSYNPVADKEQNTVTPTSRIQFRHMEPSASVEKDVEHNIELLSRFDDRIAACSVLIEAPHHHHHKGRHFKVTIRISVPGDDIVVSHGHDGTPAHEDCYVAIRDAFRSARRQVQDHVRIRRHQVKSHYPGSKQDLHRRLDERDTE